jgi:polyhydroxyalkanoate synthesis regulator phasin
MAQNQILKRYLDAGMQFTQMTQQRAEAIVKDLVKAGEVQSEQAQTIVGDIVDRSHKNSERLLEQIRKEVRNQVALAEFVTKDVVQRLQSQVEELRAQLPGARPVKKAPVKKAAAKKAPAKKAAVKKAVARKAVARKAPAKRAPSKKSAS